MMPKSRKTAANIQNIVKRCEVKSVDKNAMPEATTAEKLPSNTGFFPFIAKPCAKFFTTKTKAIAQVKKTPI